MDKTQPTKDTARGKGETARPRFLTDQRGQSVVIGSVLLFGILVLALSSYQVAVVPQQNHAAEFGHSLAVERDLLDVRNAILRTKQTGDPSGTSVSLGTTYPTRIVAVNPAPPIGTLRTTANTTMRVLDGDGNAVSVCPTSHATRSLVYTPNYNQFHLAPDLVVEHTVLYRDFGHAQIPISGQQLLQGDRINLVPIRNEFQEARFGTVAFEPRAGLLVETTVQDPTLRLATGLTEAVWEDLLVGEATPEHVAVVDGVLTLTLAGEYTVSCGPVSVNGPLPGGERSAAGAEINPAAPGDVQLVDETASGRTVTLLFNNTANDVNLTAARINFYEGIGANDPTSALLTATGSDVSATLVVGEGFTAFERGVRLAGGETTTMTLTFDTTVGTNDWFVLTVVFETGEQGLYFVSLG